MRIAKKWSPLISFAKFCQLHNASPSDVAELCTLADNRARLLARSTYTDHERKLQQSRAKKMAAEIERRAQAMGFKSVHWSGSYPTLTMKNDQQTYLPDD